MERSHGKESTKTTASDTLGGSTSADVHAGLGKPAQGMSSKELRHDGLPKRERPGQGLVGVGAEGVVSGGKPVDEREVPGQRALDREEARPGERGDKVVVGADDGLENVTAEGVAAERD